MANAQQAKADRKQNILLVAGILILLSPMIVGTVYACYLGLKINGVL